jgi:tetratricopeptide (TPR) repeat protein
MLAGRRRLQRLRAMKTPVMPSVRARCVVALLLLAAWNTAPAGAQSEESYGETIKHAVAEYESGNWAEAHTLFARAHELNPNARTWRGQGLASFESRHYLVAIEELGKSLADTRKALNAAQRREVESVLARAQQFLAVYRVSLDPPDAELRVDSQIARLEGDELRLDPGEYAVVVRALGYQEHRTTLRAEAGTRAALPVVLVSHAQIEPEPVKAKDPTPAIAQPVTEAPPPAKKTSMLWAGGIAFTLGIAAESWAWYAFKFRVSLMNDLVDAPAGDYADEQQEWADARAPLLASAITAAGLTTTGVELMLFAGPNERLPWWLAGFAAASGAGLATWGLVDVVNGECENPDVRACAWQSQRRERGTVVLLASMPLFALPVTKLARSGPRKADRADLRITAMAGGLAWSGRW